MIAFSFTRHLALAALAFTTISLHAHHGHDFILLEDWHLAAPGKGHLLTNFEWEHSGDGDEYGLAPSLMFGIAPRVALSLDVDFRDESDGWNYNAVMPAAHFQVTGPDSDLPFKVALSVGYQWADGAAGADGEEPADEHGDEHHDDHADEHQGGHDHEHMGHDHSHASSVHNHDSDALMSRLIIERDFGATKAVFNLISVARSDGGASWGYAAGVRHKVREQLAFGIEALGDFESHGWHELVGGVYYEPVHSLTLKLGAGFGLTEETPDFTLRTGFVWRF
ncbi:MAG: hypothetical protein K1X78_01780 [Verrucomicrobiaceae bacterium]|nr:hypothetical protein [Verrucomicrobiaceae bacterium]